MTITREEANELLKKDIAIFDDHLNYALGLDDAGRMPNGLPISQHQFYALLSFTYNVGIGNLARSTMLRKVKVDGTSMRTGAEFNVVKDKSFDLPLLRLVPEAKRFISDQLEERTTLESDGRFHTYPEYPEFAWVESITNAVCHRQWGLRGDYILVAKYDDRLEIKSPGRLPNIVTVDNIFTTRFARNPLISRVLTEMELVRELNEGIPRVFKEMKEAGLPEPKIVETAANVTVVLYNGKTANTSDNSSDNHLPENLSVNLSVTQQKILRMIAEKQYINATHAAEILQISRNSVNAAISVLKEKGLIVRIGEDKGGYWDIIKR